MRSESSQILFISTEEEDQKIRKKSPRGAIPEKQSLHLKGRSLIIPHHYAGRKKDSTQKHLENGRI